MAYFHYRCGERITLLNDNCTAVRNDSDFDNGLVITAEPIMNDILFEIKIDRKVNSWSGSLEIGLVDTDPLHFEFPACSSKIQASSWIMSGSSFFRNGIIVIERYGLDLDKLNQDDRIGLMRTSEGDLIFYINGESQGVAAENLPPNLYAVVDVYGKCVQVSITSPALREHNNDDCLSGSSVLAIDNDILNVTLGGDLSELSMSSSNSLDIRMDINVSLSMPEESARVDRLRFHDRCGSLVKLSNNNRTAERRRPLDEFNNGVVMTHRSLRDGELFEIRIDRLVEKWSGSIEMGITTHNPNTLVFPATMTNMRSGTIMMSGCGILTNGKGTRREYGEFNLDELSEGDRVGMMRKPDGNLHYFINGLDQGVAAQRVPTTVWGVIDLYGMTIKVSIVERDEREEQNLMTRKNTREQQHLAIVETSSQQSSLPDYYDRLTFHPNCGTHAQVVNNGRTAHRPNAVDDFNNGVVLTRRPLKTGELFQVKLDRIVTKWAGSIEIGVTTHTPVDLEFPFTMTNVRSGTWMMTGSGIMHNGTIVLEQYGVNLDRLQVGDRVGVVRKENGYLHFFVNGVDQGAAASNIPEEVYGVIDLYGQAVEATIIDMYDYGSPDTVNSSLSNTTLYSDIRFHHVHGKNARIVNGGLTAMRPRPFAEFNEAIVFSSRPLRDGELFEVCLDSVVDRWSGSIELGVTAVRPDDIELPTTATDLTRDTWMLSGSSVMENGTTIKTNYPCDLDTLGSGVRVGVVRSADRRLEFYRDGIPQGVACMVPHSTVYAVIDLYGQCAQVSIPCVSPLTQMSTSANALDNNCPRSETCLSIAQQAISSLPPVQTDLYFFSESHSKDITLSEDFRVAKRTKDPAPCAIVSSAVSLVPEELYEITIVSLVSHLAGNLVIGLADTLPSTSNSNSIFNCRHYLIDNELRHQNKTIQLFTPSLNWLNVGDRIGFLRTNDNTVKVFINSEDISVVFPASQPEAPMFVVIDLRGACNSVAITSHKLLLSPMMNSSCRLQDSLELVLHPEEDVSLNSQNNEENSTEAQMITYEFSENHGRNIELIDGRVRARRVASYNQGLVVIQPAIEVNGKVKIQIEEVDMKWQSSLMVGIAAGPPDRMTLPMNLLAFKPPCCILANDWISINGVKSRSTYGQKLSNLVVGDIVAIQLTTFGVVLSVNEIEEDVVPWTLPTGQIFYAVFDLYGQCQQIKIVDTEENEEASNVDKKLVNDFEKADLENYEKERLTLSIPSAATSSMPSSNLSRSPQSPHLKMLSCVYKDECILFKEQLLLPDCYFNLDECPDCFCANCCKIKSQSCEKDSSLLDWVRFPLKNNANQSTEKWHTAFYSAKIGAIRCILDKGQPLTKGQSQWSNLVIQQEDDLQVVFYPTVQKLPNFGFKLKNNKQVFAAFQLLVKPNAYSVSRDSQEWCTKETGAIVLHSLLIHISD